MRSEISARSQKYSRCYRGGIATANPEISANLCASASLRLRLNLRLRSISGRGRNKSAGVASPPRFLRRPFCNSADRTGGDGRSSPWFWAGQTFVYPLSQPTGVPRNKLNWFRVNYSATARRLPKLGAPALALALYFCTVLSTARGTSYRIHPAARQVPGCI